MAASMWQVGDELWRVVEPLVPVHEPDPRGGRPRVAAPSARAGLLAGDRACRLNE